MPLLLEGHGFIAGSSDTSCLESPADISNFVGKTLSLSCVNMSRTVGGWRAVQEEAGSTQAACDVGVSASAVARLTLFAGGDAWKQPDWKQSARTKQIAAGCAIVIISLGWAASFAFACQPLELLAWSTTFLLIAGVTISWLYGNSCLPAIALFRPGSAKPLSLTQSLALSLISFSLALLGWLAMHGFKLQEPRMVRRQVIEIELVRPACVPGSEQIASSPAPPVPTQAISPVSPTRLVVPNKILPRSAPPKRAQHIPVASQPPVNLPKMTANPEVFIEQPVEEQRPKPAPKRASVPARWADNMVAQGNYKGFASGSDSHWVTNNVQPLVSVPVVKTTSSSESIQEVAPPQLVEVMGNPQDGKADSVGQHGNKPGGTKNPFLLYLSELHKRIKSAWAPPAGETRTAQILFCIKTSGDLKSIKLVQSSGDPDTDEAALNAITNCFPYKPLPQSLPQGSLDVLYTFNYRVDKLSEVAGARSL